MSTITLRVDDSFSQTVSALSRELHISKTALIKEAVLAYRQQLEAKKVRDQMAKASRRVQMAAVDEDRELWDGCVADGLEDV